MDGEIVIGTRLDTKKFDSQIAEAESKLERLKDDREILASQETIGERDLELLKKYDAEIEKINNRLVELQRKKNELEDEDDSKGIDLHLDSIIKKVAKWGLALFGIRGAYSMIRRAMSTLAEQDSNLSAQVQYIQWALANAIAPIVKWIISAVKLIMDYINKIWNMLFGFDLFKGPKEFAKSMKSASGSAKEIKKSLAGFDEMNILGNNTTASGGGVDTPSFDTEGVLEGLNKVKSKIKEVGKTMRDTTKDMEKSLEDPRAYKKAYGNADWLMMGITRMGVGVNNVIFGIYDIIVGISKIIVGIVKGDEDLILQGAKQLGQGIREIFYGVVSFVLGLFEMFSGTIKLLFTGLLKFLETTFLPIMRNLFGPIGSIIAYPIISAVANAKAMFESLASGIKKVFEGVLKFIKGDFKGGIKNVFDGLKDILLAPFRGMREGINKIIKGLNKIKLPKALGGASISIPEIPKFAKGTIINNPGKGVPIGIGGEVGKEAILPLSDARLLEELGSTIGRYITINLTNETKLDGRTIARKVSQLSNSENFLRNR